MKLFLCKSRSLETFANALVRKGDVISGYDVFYILHPDRPQLQNDISTSLLLVRLKRGQAYSIDLDDRRLFC